MVESAASAKPRPSWSGQPCIHSRTCLGPTFEAADANFVTHAGWLPRHHAGMRVIDQRDLVLIDSGLPCDTFNLICRARLAPAKVPDRARAALGIFPTGRAAFFVVNWPR
jgi:hypothetical protein